MIEIKFRQAIPEKDGTSRWRYWGYLHTDTFGLPVFINPLGSVEWDKRPSYQFTGLKDKNGTEIYEGDILKCSMGVYLGEKHERYEQVIVKSGCPCHVFPNGQLYIDNVVQAEIIGDILQNPELMKN